MEKTDSRYANYIQILKEELLPAMGCTEPIAIAYAAAKAAAVLGTRPEHLLIEVSGNIIKNVKSVVVPHTGGLRGIPAAAAAGAAAETAGDGRGGLLIQAGHAAHGHENCLGAVITKVVKFDCFFDSVFHKNSSLM